MMLKKYSECQFSNNNRRDYLTGVLELVLGVLGRAGIRLEGGG